MSHGKKQKNKQHFILFTLEMVGMSGLNATSLEFKSIKTLPYQKKNPKKTKAEEIS